LLWLGKDRYRQTHPIASDVQLAIEVAFNSHAYYLEQKRLLHAATGIVEYWIVDATASCIHVFTNPKQGDYSVRQIFKYGETRAYSPLDEVKSNIESTRYPLSLVHYIVGRVEVTLPTSAPKEIALPRLDTDFYESTKHELLYLFPNLASGGILIIDDYGSFEEARRAVDEYIAENKLKIFLNRIDSDSRIAVKP